METPTRKLCKVCKSTPVKDRKHTYCSECKKAARKKYYQGYVKLNKERIAARMQQYDAMRKAQGLREHQQFPERTRARMKQYYADHIEDFQKYRETHKEERQQNWREWAAKNAESLTHYQETHREQTKARVQAWARNFPEKNRARVKRRRAAKTEAPLNDLTAAQWEEIKNAYGHRCAYCHRKMKRLTQDHITPVSKGGSHTLANVVPACQSCNSKKHAKAPLVPVQPLLLTLAPAKPYTKRV